MASAAAVKRSRYNSARATYGSTAYDLDYRRGGVEAVPRPLVRPREKAAVRPKVRVREAGKVSVFAVAGFLAVGVFALLVILSGIQLTALSDDIAALNKEMTVLQGEEGRLRTQYELAFDLASIQSAVTSNGSMVKPQSGQILYLDLSEPDSVVLFRREEPPLKGVSGAFESAKEVITNVLEYFK
jgi:hypothetical protein